MLNTDRVSLRKDRSPLLSDVARPWAALDAILARVKQVGECWLWMGGREGRSGYGTVWIEGRQWSVHRFVHAIAGGSLRDEVMHTCDVPPCCNPAHLVSGTHAENIADAGRKGRMRHARLTRETAAAIRARKRESRYTLAAEFGVSPASILNVLSGATWR